MRRVEVSDPSPCVKIKQFSPSFKVCPSWMLMSSKLPQWERYLFACHFPEALPKLPLWQTYLSLFRLTRRWQRTWQKLCFWRKAIYWENVTQKKKKKIGFHGYMACNCVKNTDLYFHLHNKNVINTNGSIT